MRLEIEEVIPQNYTIDVQGILNDKDIDTEKVEQNIKDFDSCITYIKAQVKKFPTLFDDTQLDLKICLKTFQCGDNEGMLNMIKQYLTNLLKNE